MTQMDGVGFFESMKDQEEATIKETRKATILREVAVNTGTGLAELKIDSSTQTPHEIRTGRGMQTQHETFDMTRDDEMEEHEEQLAEELKIKRNKKQLVKDKLREMARKHLAKKIPKRMNLWNQQNQPQGAHHLHSHLHHHHHPLEHQK